MRTTLLLAALIAGCGTTENSTERGPQGPTGSGCSVTDTTDGATITCEDGTTADIRDGQDGKDGVDGTVGPAGEQGAPGTDGKDGQVVEVKTPLIYEGYYCGRTVVSVDEDYYIIISGLVKLTDKWYKVSNSCEVRRKDGKIETK